MTRFPDTEAWTADPAGRALGVIRDTCEGKGLQFHLASDRAISDDLWTNVAAHMGASRYGVALFEDRAEPGCCCHLIKNAALSAFPAHRYASRILLVTCLLALKSILPSIRQASHH